MADADRLRAAADRLDEWTVLGRDELTANGSATAALLREAADSLDPGWDVQDYGGPRNAEPLASEQDRATAALLRAVADERVCGCFPWWTVDGVGGDTRAAALALASIILGAES